MSAAARFERRLNASEAAATAALAAAADDWGAVLPEAGGRGEFLLPVLAGVRRGVLEVRVEVRPEGVGASRVVLEVHRRRWRLHRSAVGILTLGAAGGLCVALWPFYPSLLPLAPIAAALAVTSWLLVGARLRSAGPEEFLDTVAAHVGARGGAGPEAPDGALPASEPARDASLHPASRRE